MTTDCPAAKRNTFPIVKLAHFVQNNNETSR